MAMSFQAARLQLMRSRVDLEVASAAGFSPHDQTAWPRRWPWSGWTALAKRRIDQLSGGQMRRVVLAGLLARSPRALILDEPLAGLDAVSQRGLLRLLAELRREQRSDGGGHLARLRRAGRAVPAHLASARRRAGTASTPAGGYVVTAPSPPSTTRPPRRLAGRAAASRCPGPRPSTSCGPAPNCLSSLAFRCC